MLKKAGLSLLFLLSVFANVVNAAEPIKLGAVVPLKDVAGKESANAMKLAVKEINQAGGVLGRPLELIVIDDEMNPGKGAAAIDKLATEDKVDIFVGGLSSGVHLAQIPVLKKYNKITVWSGAASARCEGALKDQDWYFHLHPWDYQQTASYFEGWRAIGEKYPNVKLQKWFIAYEDGTFGTMTFKAHVELLPQGWVHQGADFRSATAQGGGDYHGALRRAKEVKPDVFVWVGHEADAIALTNQAKEMAFYPPVFIGSPPSWPTDFGKSPLSENISLYGLWSPAMNSANKASRRFSEAYKKEFGEDASTYLAPLSYSNIQIVAKGIGKAGSLDSKTLIAALEQTKYESPLGDTITFKPSKIIKHQGLDKQKILQWQKGVQQVIWPFELATAKFVFPYKP